VPKAVRAEQDTEVIHAERPLAPEELHNGFLDDFTVSTFYDAGWGRINVDPFPGSGENIVQPRGYGLGFTWVRPGSFSLRASLAWRATGRPISDPHDHNPLLFVQAVKTF
jgi:hypothetical protein